MAKNKCQGAPLGFPVATIIHQVKEQYVRALHLILMSMLRWHPYKINVSLNPKILFIPKDLFRLSQTQSLVTSINRWTPSIRTNKAMIVQTQAIIVVLLIVIIQVGHQKSLEIKTKSSSCQSSCTCLTNTMLRIVLYKIIWIKRFDILFQIRAI